MAKNPAKGKSVEEKFKELEDRLREVDDLNSASALLDWDQATYMPPGGGPARASDGDLESPGARKVYRRGRW